MTEYQPHDANPKRGWFRYSLRGLLLMMALIAVYLGGRVILPVGAVPAADCRPMDRAPAVRL